MKLKYLICFMCIIMILFVGCSNMGDQNGHADRSSTKTRSDQGTSKENREDLQGEDGDVVVKNQKLKGELEDLTYSHLKVQNKTRKNKLGEIYTKDFIEKTIKKDNGFYKNNVRIIKNDDEPYPLVIYYKKTKIYEVTLHVLDDSKENEDSSYFQIISIKRDSQNRFKIYQVNYSV